MLSYIFIRSSTVCVEAPKFNTASTVCQICQMSSDAELIIMGKKDVIVTQLVTAT
jgi:hypothetical protein